MGSYEVQSGDNLWKIVKTTFKLTDATQINEKVKEIATLNKIKNTNSIFIGQKLNLGETEKEESSNTLPKTATRSFEFGKQATQIEPKADNPTKEVSAQASINKSSEEDTQYYFEKFAPEKFIPKNQEYLTQNTQKVEITQPNTQEKIPEETPVKEEVTKPQNQNQDKQEVSQQEEQSIPLPTAKDKWLKTPDIYLNDTIKTVLKQEDIQIPLADNIPTETAETKEVKKSDLPDFLNVNPHVEKEDDEPPFKIPKLTMEQYSQIAVTTEFKGSAEDINKHLKGVLEGKGDKFIELQEKYGINAAFLAGIVMNESANGTSNLAIKNKNVGGVRIPGSRRFKKYDDVGECIEHMAKFLSDHYIQEGRTTIGAIGAKYCPVTDETDEDNLNQYWPRNVGSNMAKIDPKNTIA